MKIALDKTFCNALFCNDLEALQGIHEEDKNIAIYQRSIDLLELEIDQLLACDFKFKQEGSIPEIEKLLDRAFHEFGTQSPEIHKDIMVLLKFFQELTRIKNFRVYLSTISTDMCRRFHTDINYLRLLCTYRGNGTWWLPEVAANREAHAAGDDNDNIVRDPHQIQQAAVGDVLILKGALYPMAKAVIHRSPAIEYSGQKRLLLRIDTNQSLFQ